MRRLHTWKILATTGLATVMLAATLAGCTAVPTQTPAAEEAATLSEEAATEDAEIADEDELTTALQDALQGMLGNLGSAGGTMKLAKRTVNLLMLASRGGYSEEVVTPVAEEFVAGLNDDERMDFLDEWEGAKNTADQILNDYDSVKELLEDAGCEEEAETLQKDPAIAEEWDEMKAAIDEVMAREALIKVEQK